MVHFIIYGLLGWCAEIIWTGLGSFVNGDVRLTAKTYLWMFPIYGLAIFFEPLVDVIQDWSLWSRGAFWMLICFAVEYSTGWIIRRITGTVPWDYSRAKFNVHGLIRLDYAPVWFSVGLIFEKVHNLLTWARI
jgi:uncharacterized membrane protein